MLVYRVEDETEIGPYNSGLYVYDMLAAHAKDPERVSPYRDPRLRFISEYHEYCGFDSMEALAWWFQDFGQALEDEGFIISTYEVDPAYVRHGERQLVFQKSAAKRLGKRLPTKYIDKKEKQ